MTTIETTTPRILRSLAAAAIFLLATAARAAVPGITGPNFSLTATEGFITQPDGNMVYSWGYGCTTAWSSFAPGGIAGAYCGGAEHPMQIPGPTLIVTEGQTVRVTLTNKLPAAAGNTSLLFPGFNVTALAQDPGVPGVLTQEAQHGGTVTYTFTATSPGTRAYYSGTQGDLQVEMGLFGAIVVLPNTVPSGCTAVGAVPPHYLPEADFRLAASAYDHPKTCYDREYLFQFSEMDPAIHTATLAQVTASRKGLALGVDCSPGTPGCSLTIATEPYHPAYFMINGRSMPDDMDPVYARQYPNQPYNGNPHMHPGELTLLRIIGQGRWQHPFHEHGNHVRILARDANLILSSSDPNDPNLAGPLLFTTTTTPGMAMDGLFYWTGKGLNWDAFGHSPSVTPGATCDGKLNGHHSVATDPNYYEWCQDHNKPVESKPFGAVAAGGPMTLPDPNILANGPWYGGSPYLGPDATTRAVGNTPIPPFGTVANSPTDEAGFAFMWHSHNEREITTNNIFPGGMLMMMLVDSREFVIDESL